MANFFRLHKRQPLESAPVSVRIGSSEDLPGHHCPRDPEIEREHRGSHEDASPNVLPEAAGVLLAAEGRAAPHWHDSSPDAEVGEQPQWQDEELERADE